MTNIIIILTSIYRHSAIIILPKACDFAIRTYEYSVRIHAPFRFESRYLRNSYDASLTETLFTIKYSIK